jgi:adenosylcobalamin-dependent ribonucleoside-triphosphate reductase
MFDIAAPSFTLPDSFLTKYRGKQPEWGPLGYFTYKRTYSRAIEGESRSEEYWETCRRVVEGTFSIQRNHCKRNHLPWDERKAQRTAKRMFELMWAFKFLPPGRGLWAMGTKYVQERGGAALNNCAFVSTKDLATDPVKPFLFIMDMSMVGVGVGFDTMGAGKLTIKEITVNRAEPFVVPDTREGWVEALRLLLEAYVNGTPGPWYDFSLVRPEGAPIKGFGGTASGPQPLIEMLQDIRGILDGKVGQTLSSADIVDIGNLIGRCVVAGNVRRSAEIVFGDPTDETFALLKQDKAKLTHHRWASNNSIFATVGMDYAWHARQTALNGEPGYMWLDNARAYGRMKDPADWADREAVGGNPCLEQTLHQYELCTLVETFPSRHESLEEYFETLKIAYLYAKTVTLIPTHWAETNSVMAKNRRIGLSQSGIIKAFGRHGRREMLRWCDKGYEFISGLDVQYSNWLGVPKSIKKTSVKPSGTISLLAGEPPGIHYPHSEYYIRRIRVGTTSPLVESARQAGYKIEPAVGQEANTVCIEFPIKEEFFVRSKDDVSIWEQVANAVAYQRYWADNQVSVTVTFKPVEKEDIQHILELYEDSLKGISFLPIEEHGYVQAPYETITKEQYLEMSKDLKPIVFDDASEGDAVAPKYCDSDSCEL